MLSRALIRADLNLLVALQALLEERNVTRAAERLYITQPALSKTLQKLRDLFEDDLFTRVPHGLVPTPKALEIEERLPEVLRQLNNIVGGADFHPADYVGEFRLAMPESFSAWVMPRLLARLAKEAPGVTLHVEDPGQHFVDDLASGRLDFAFHVAKEYPGAIYVESLGNLEASCLVRAGHPLASITSLSMDDFLSYPHLRLYLARLTKEDVGLVDERLSELGLRRQLLMETTHLSTCLGVLQSTDSILVSSELVLECFSGGDVVALPLPAELEESGVEVGLIYHRRVRGHEPHRWLKSLVTELLARI